MDTSSKSPSAEPEPISIAVAVVEHAHRFLIGERPAGTSLGGLWEFPGGKVQTNEHPARAAVRECWEETALRVKIRHVYGNVIHQYDHDWVCLHFFACIPVLPLGHPKSPFRWVDVKSLQTYQFPAANAILLEQIRNSHSS